jgi:tRNA(Ile)-lysidine synthase
LTAWFTLDALTVRGWLAGDKLRPLAGAGHRLVVRCFQDARVPKSRREGWPILAGANEVVWVPGVCRSDALVPPGGSEALRVDADLV